jgi:hypothetical protein
MGVDSRQGREFFSLLLCPGRLCGPPVQWIPRIKRLKHEADHSPRRGQRMSGAIPPLPQNAFMAWCLFKHRDKFTFSLPFTGVSISSRRNESATQKCHYEVDMMTSNYEQRRLPNNACSVSHPKYTHESTLVLNCMPLTNHKHEIIFSILKVVPVLN